MGWVLLVMHVQGTWTYELRMSATGDDRVTKAKSSL